MPYCRSVAFFEIGRTVELSLFYFANDVGDERGRDVYRLLLEGARFADANGLTAVWTPERHFHPFGGAYPNPSLTATAVAVATEKVGVRAGSVVAPLHNPVRIAEEWAVADNLSRGRVGVSFASGWNPVDFVLAPTAYDRRKALTAEAIETVRALWRGEAIELQDAVGGSARVRLFPRPVQAELPVWLTSSGNPETFREAGRLQANLLTHLLGQDVETLAKKIRVYRDASAEAGRAGHVTLMLHTFLGEDVDEIRETVRSPFSAYIKSALDLDLAAAKAKQELGQEDMSERDIEYVVEQAFERYFETSGLFGTPASRVDFVRRLAAVGVDEIACLIDFGVDEDDVLASLDHLGELARLVAATPADVQPEEGAGVRGIDIPA
jgi:natural product biosynthesis luciferase-like monooxygenase protein